MTSVIKFTFNAFHENTYIVVDTATKQCVIFDPGCYEPHEKEELRMAIQQKGLQPVRLINTHCHLDHVFGNKFVSETWNLGLEIHRGELPVLEAIPQVCAMYGLPPAEPSPTPSHFIEEGEEITFGNTTLKVLFTPGHSPASLSFYCEKSKFVIAGDVLFQRSIGRTDLPGGNFNTLIDSIKQKLFPLGDEVKVYAGHMGETTIGEEKQFNPFFS